MCWAEVCFFPGEFGVVGSWVEVVEFEGVGGAGWCGVVDGLFAEPASCALFLALLFVGGGGFSAESTCPFRYIHLTPPFFVPCSGLEPVACALVGEFVLMGSLLGQTTRLG